METWFSQIYYIFHIAVRFFSHLIPNPFFFENWIIYEIFVNFMILLCLNARYDFKLNGKYAKSWLTSSRAALQKSSKEPDFANQSKSKLGRLEEVFMNIIHLSDDEKTTVWKSCLQTASKMVIFFLLWSLLRHNGKQLGNSHRTLRVFKTKNPSNCYIKRKNNNGS